MDGIWDFFRHLLDSSDFNPRNTCGAGWNGGLVWLHVVSDGLIWLSYLAIPCVLVYFVRKRRDVPFPHLFWLFGAFILSCGTTHLVSMFMFSWPMYRLDGFVKLVTAVVSLGTVGALIPAMPRFLAMRSPRELEVEVAARTAELHEANRRLQAEIVQHKAIVKTLQETEARKTAILESALDCIISMDRDGKIVEFNPAAEKAFGYTRAHVLGKALAEVIIPPALREQHSRGLEKYRETGVGPAIGKRLEMPALRADGTEFLAEVSITAVRWDGPPLFTGFLRDITEQKRAEAHFRHAVEAAPNGMLKVSENGQMVLVNQVAARMFGYSPEELIGQTVERLVPERFRDPHPQHRMAFFAAPKPRSMGAGRDLFGLRKDGTEFPVEIGLNPFEAPDGHFVLASIIDITERRHADLKLQAQLERMNLLHQITRATAERQDLRSIFQVVIRSLEDQLPIDFGCMCLYDATEKSLTVTSVGVKSQPLAQELIMPERARIGIDQNGLSRCVKGQLVYESDIGKVDFPFPQRLVRGGLRSLVVAPLLVESSVLGVLVAARKEADTFSSGECDFLRQLSEHVALAAHQAQLNNALQRAYDDLRQTQQAVMQQERLRALGQMASGIAHDINNAVSPVALYTEFLLEKEPNLSERARGYLQTIQRAIGDVAATVARMREFYRQREPQLSLAPVDLNRLVKQVADLTRARWSDMPQQRGVVIQLRSELAQDLPAIMVVESEIREALTNLVFNAVDAMPDGGTLTLRTRAAGDVSSTEEGLVRRFVHVEVVDTGVGMDEDTRRRCLEPFFTTKGERGTGLGLAMVYGVMQRHSADIEIESALGKGTSVRLIFAAPAHVVTGPVQPETAAVVASRLRILVVDDDPLLLKSLQDTLESDGHVLHVANGGQAGIDAFRAAQSRGEPFAVVITDLGMPYVDGRKVASAIKGISPSTPIILLTGWGQRLMADGDVPPHVDRVLSKPPKLRELREALKLCR